MIQTVLCLLHDAISLVSGVKWLADSSSIGFPISSIALHRLVTLLRNVIWMLPVSSWCFLLAHMFFSLYSFVIRNHAADFWPSNHPFSEGWFILGGADCTSFTFDHSIVLFVDLINRHSWEIPLSFVHHKVSLVEQFGDFRMMCINADHVFEMDCIPVCVIDIIKKLKEQTFFIHGRLPEVKCQDSH